MTVAELFGILTASTGIFLALTMPEGDRALQLGPLRLTTGVSAGILAVTGLLVLAAVYAQPAAWWQHQPDAIESGIFWLAAAAALGGAFGTLRARTTRGLMLALVALAAGATCLFGTAGDVLAASACLVAVGLLGWKLQTSTADSLSQPTLPHLADAESRVIRPDESVVASVEDRHAHPDDSQPPATAGQEPLLVTVTLLLVIWLLGSGVYSVVNSEARPSPRSQNPRALPRPFLRETTESETPVRSIANQPWLSSAIGLLIATSGIALLRTGRRSVNKGQTGPASDDPAADEQKLNQETSDESPQVP